MNNENNKSGTSMGEVIFHLFMIFITGGVWLGILIIWLVVKAVSQK